jgi:hypothetical protein
MARDQSHRFCPYLRDLALITCIFLLAGGIAKEAHAAMSEKQVSIPLLADTKDLHISVSDDITKVEGIKDFSETQTVNGKYSAAWTTPPEREIG